MHERIFGGGEGREGRDRRADIRASAADRLGTYERARSLVNSEGHCHIIPAQAPVRNIVVHHLDFYNSLNIL